MPLQTHLHALESSGLIYLAATQPDLEYLFRHALVQEAAYNSVLRQDRRRLHLAVGEALESQYANQLESYSDLLAYHYSRAENWDKTLTHARAAAARAKRLYASTEALIYYDLALTALKHLDEATTEAGQPSRQWSQRFDVLSERQGVWTLVGQFERGRTDLEEMAALAREAGDDVRLSDALNGLANLYQNTGIDDPRAPLEEALAVKRRLGDKRGEADSLNLLTTVYISLGQIAEGLAASAEAHDLYEALNDTDGLARNEWSLGLTLYEVIGDYARAIEHLDRSLTLSRQVNNRALECGNMMVIGSANVRLGDYPAGRGYLEPAIEMAKQIGDRPAEGWALLYLSWHDRELKEFETSHARVQIASDIGKEIGSDNLLWYVLLSLTRLHLAWSRPHTALPFAQQTYEFSQRLSVWGETRPRSGALLARTYRQIGRLDEARRYALEALREMEAFHEEAVTEPHGVYMDCYRALSASGAPEAPIALQQAYTALMHLADKITDPERRARFLTDVTMSREIVAEWEAFNQ